MTDISKEAFDYQCECNLSYVSKSDKVTVEIGQQHLKDMYAALSARIAELEARPVTVQEAAKVLLMALGPDYNPKNKFWGAVIDYIMKSFKDDAHVRGSDGILAALRALSEAGE